MPIEGGITELRVDFENIAREEALEAANRWYSKAVDLLYEGGDDYDYEVFPVAQSSTPPEFDDSVQGYAFAFPHPAAWYFEKGTEPHTIEPTNADALVFEWPDAPPEIREMYEDTFPTVFFPRVEVDGIERLDYVERGRAAAERYLEGR